MSLRAVVQRVTKARVLVDQEVSGEITHGFVVLLGVGVKDTESDVAYLVDKIAGLRVFADLAGKMNNSLAECQGEVLAISQFTLHGDCRRGKRPSFDQAARPETAIPLYNDFVARLRARGITVATGSFGAMMQVELVNDGPVTILLDSEKVF